MLSLFLTDRQSSGGRLHLKESKFQLQTASQSVTSNFFRLNFFYRGTADGCFLCPHSFLSGVFCGGGAAALHYLPQGSSLLHTALLSRPTHRHGKTFFTRWNNDKLPFVQCLPLKKTNDSAKEREAACQQRDVSSWICMAVLEGLE